MDKDIWYYVLGFTAQALFSARLLIQWILTEKAKRVISPTIFWQLSLLASILLSLYGWLRGDFTIILGQFFSYYIYIWNLDAKQNWKKIPQAMRYIILSIPVLAICYVIYKGESSVNWLFESIPTELLLFGSAGQIIFTFRFIYQWWYSRKREQSLLPAGFWIISLVGSLIIVAYGIVRKDPVLILGQSVGFIAYIRNLYFSFKSRE